MDIALVVAALAVGLLLGGLVAQQRAARRTADAERARDAAAQAQARAEEQARAAERALEQWKSEAAAQRTREDALRAERAAAEDVRRAQEIAALKGEFALLSQQALKGNSQAFMEQAGQSFEERRKQMDALLAPLKEQLEKLQQGTQALETKREGAYATLQEQVAALRQATDAVQTSSRSLLSALRGDARARGRWGEMALRNVVEMSGMTAHCDFDLQEVLDDKSRPDMVVNLPGGDGRIPVDAKAPMDAYMRAVETTDLDARAAALIEHAGALRLHVKALAGRDYAATLATRVDFTVLFVPGEPILSAAFEADPALQSEAMERRILLATPVTLLALLRTVALYWRQANLAEDAEHIAEAAGTLHDRVRKFAEHLEGLGGALDSAVKKWNEAVGSYESRVLPAGRDLEKLAPPADDRRRLPDLPAVDRAPRELPAPKPRESEAG
jgi:DNA recombination protein RmuC